MFLTIFLAIIFCAAITLMLISAVVFIKDKKLFSSAPKEALELVIDRKQEEFYGARKSELCIKVTLKAHSHHSFPSSLVINDSI